MRWCMPVHSAASPGPPHQTNRGPLEQGVLGSRRAGGERVRVGVATFDAAVHFYSLRDGRAAPAMLVVPNAEHPCCAACACLVGFAGRRWCRSVRRPARLQHASLAARRTLPRRSVSNRECAAACEGNYSRSGGAWLWGALVGAVQSRDPA